MKKIGMLVMSSIMLTAAAAQAHDYTRAEIGCEFDATRKTFAQPDAAYLGYEHHFLGSSHSTLKVAMRVETDETSALVATGTMLANVAGEPVTLTSAGVTTPMYELAELPGRPFWQADAKDVPSVDITFTDAQVRAIMATLNKGALDLPAGDLSAVIPQFALAHANDYNGVAYYQNRAETIDFAAGTRNDGLSYELGVLCQIKALNGERSGD